MSNSFIKYSSVLFLLYLFGISPVSIIFSSMVFIELKDLISFPSFKESSLFDFSLGINLNSSSFSLSLSSSSSSIFLTLFGNVKESSF